jgi:predicted metal-dependent hydrolase
MATDVLARGRARESIIVSDRVARAEQAQRALSTAVGPSAKPRRPAEDVDAERAAAEARLEETQRRLENLPRWRRRERDQLVEQMVQQSRAVQHWRERADATAISSEQPDGRGGRAVAEPLTGRERLATQAADRAVVIEMLVTPEPPTIDFDVAPLDTGLEL